LWFINNRKVFHIVLEAGKFKIRAPADVVSGVPCPKMEGSLLTVLMWWKR
jgi:hypothetical protein